MLIHTTRFTDVQGTIKSQVESVFDSIKPPNFIKSRE